MNKRRSGVLSAAALMLPTAAAMLAVSQEAGADVINFQPMVMPSSAGIADCSLIGIGSTSVFCNATATVSACSFAAWVYAGTTGGTITSFFSVGTSSFATESLTAEFACAGGLGGADHNRRLIFSKPSGV